MNKLTFEGQQFKYEHSTHTLYIEIKEPFYSAGKKLGWKENSAGLGFNKKIMEFIKEYKCHVCVKVGTTSKWYWQSYDKIIDFINKNNCEWTVKNGVVVEVVAWKLFIRIMESKEI